MAKVYTYNSINSIYKKVIKIKYIDIYVCDDYVVITYIMSGKLAQLKVTANQLERKGDYHD